MRKTETLNLRVSAEFKKRLIEEAKKEKRSVTNYLEATLSSLWNGRKSTGHGTNQPPSKT
jgi:predicted HicB family RNase H-like nuclease